MCTVELMGNAPRLISPCIDVPLASVQIERTDSLEMVPGVRYCTVLYKLGQEFLDRQYTNASSSVNRII